MKVERNVIEKVTIQVSLTPWEAMVLAELTEYIAGSGDARDFTDNLGEQLADACKREIVNKVVDNFNKSYHGIWLRKVEREKDE